MKHAMTMSLAVGLWIAPVTSLGAQAAAAHTLLPTPTTVAWGYYDAAAAPVLHIRSGDVNVGVHVMIPKSIFPRGAGEHMIPVKR